MSTSRVVGCARLTASQNLVPVSRTLAISDRACQIRSSRFESSSLLKLKAHVRANRLNASVLASDGRLTEAARRPTTSLAWVATWQPHYAQSA